MVRIEDISQLRRGMIVSWEWGANAAGRAALADGLKSRGRILTQADVPGLSRRFALQVEGRPDWLIDPARAIAEGRSMFLERAAELPEVLNARVSGREREGAVYVGRPSEWGNPFVLGRHGDRDEVMRRYIAWLHENPRFVQQVRVRLAGQDLICWCHPEACHGHVLRDIAAGADLPALPEENQPDLFAG